MSDEFSGARNTPPAQYHLRLFVAGTTARSLRAIENLQRICAKHLPERLDLEVIDIYQQPELARQHQVIAVPSLVRHLPLPLRRIIGDLSEEGRVLNGLGLMPVAGDRNPSDDVVGP